MKIEKEENIWKTTIKEAFDIYGGIKEPKMNTGNESKRIVRTLRRVKTKQQIVISKIENKKNKVWEHWNIFAKVKDQSFELQKKSKNRRHTHKKEKLKHLTKDKLIFEIASK